MGHVQTQYDYTIQFCINARWILYYLLGQNCWHINPIDGFSYTIDLLHHRYMYQNILPKKCLYFVAFFLLKNRGG